MKKLTMSLENSKDWWEQKFREMNGEERKAVLLKKLQIFMWIEIFVIFLSAVTNINIWIPIGAIIFFLAHSLHLEYERKIGAQDKKALEKKVSAYLEEWTGVVSLFERIFCEDWDKATVRAFEEEYNLKNGLSESELAEYDRDVKSLLTECMTFVHLTYQDEEMFKSQGAYDQMKKSQEELQRKYNMGSESENCYLHEIVLIYKERIAQWAHT